VRAAPQPRTLATMTRRAHVTRWFAAGIASALVTIPMVAHADGAPAAPPKSVPTPTKPVAPGAPTQEAAPTTASDVPPSTNAGADPSSNEPPERDEPNVTPEGAYDRAIREYAAGNLVGALNDMEQSYALSRQPELLYNIAKIERELGQCPSALSTYQKYLHDIPTGTQRVLAIDGVRVLSAECGRPATPAAPGAPLTTTAPPTYWTTPHLVGWSAIATGAAAGVASLAFGLGSNGPAQSYRKPPYPTADYERAERLRNAARVFGIAGGALVTGGLLCLTLWHERREQSAPSVSLALSPEGAAFGYSRTF